MASESKLVLIIGINGFIAAQLAAAFLNSGFRVRGTVRSKHAATEILDRFRTEVKESRLEIVDGVELTAPGAFDEAVKDATVIAHTASLVSFAQTDPEPMMKAAVQGTESLLRAALTRAGPQLKTVILASSAQAVASPDKPQNYVYTEADWNNFALEQVEKLGKATPGALSYAASKTAGEKAFWKFRDEFKPSFAMTAICPALVYGPPAFLPADKSKLSIGTGIIWNMFSGNEVPAPFGGTGTAVDVRDVARLFVFAAENTAKADGQRYLAVGGIAHPQAVADILNDKFPERTGQMKTGNPGIGYAKNLKSDRMDAGKAERDTGKGWIGLRESVVDTAKVLRGYF